MMQRSCEPGKRPRVTSRNADSNGIHANQIPKIETVCPCARVLREDSKVPGQGENPHYELLWKSNIGRSANSVSPGMHSGGKDVTMVVFWSSELEFEKTKVCENPASKGPKCHELGIWHCCSRGNLCQSAKGLYICPCFLTI